MAKNVAKRSKTYRRQSEDVEALRIMARLKKISVNDTKTTATISIKNIPIRDALIIKRLLDKYEY